jgi:hypothetical protein
VFCFYWRVSSSRAAPTCFNSSYLYKIDPGHHVRWYFFSFLTKPESGRTAHRHRSGSFVPQPVPNLVPTERDLDQCWLRASSRWAVLSATKGRRSFHLFLARAYRYRSYRYRYYQRICFAFACWARNSITFNIQLSVSLLLLSSLESDSSTKTIYPY